MQRQMRREKEEYWTYNPTLNIYKIVEETKSEGPGKRFAIWVQGCSRMCKGCFAKETWSFETNQIYTVYDIISIIQRHPEVEGITILGGEPLEQSAAIVELVSKARMLGLSVVLFTGYTFNNIKESDNTEWKRLLGCIDVLIDGEYREAEKCFDIPLIGSRNQNILFLTDRYTISDFTNNRIEIRIKKNGTILYNGMGDFESIKTNFKE